MWTLELPTLHIQYEVVLGWRMGEGGGGLGEEGVGWWVGDGEEGWGRGGEKRVLGLWEYTK